jgi:hypothetical protein
MPIIAIFFKKRQFLFSIIYICFFIYTFTLYFHSESKAQGKINEGDYLSVEKKRFHGRGPRVGTVYWLGILNSEMLQQVTLNMFNTRALLINIQTDRKNSGVIMLVSEVGTPRILKAVWKCDNILEPIIFWTDRFWIPENECSFLGCPKIRFQATSGECDLFILDKKVVK